MKQLLHQIFLISIIFVIYSFGAAIDDWTGELGNSRVTSAPATWAEVAAIEVEVEPKYATKLIFIINEYSESVHEDDIDNDRLGSAPQLVRQSYCMYSVAGALAGRLFNCIYDPNAAMVLGPIGFDQVKAINDNFFWSPEEPSRLFQKTMKIGARSGSKIIQGGRERENYWDLYFTLYFNDG